MYKFSVILNTESKPTLPDIVVSQRNVYISILHRQTTAPKNSLISQKFTCQYSYSQLDGHYTHLDSFPIGLYVISIFRVEFGGEGSNLTLIVGKKGVFYQVGKTHFLSKANAPLDQQFCQHHALWLMRIRTYIQNIALSAEMKNNVTEKKILQKSPSTYHTKSKHFKIKSLQRSELCLPIQPYFQLLHD